MISSHQSGSGALRWGTIPAWPLPLRPCRVSPSATTGWRCATTTSPAPTAPALQAWTNDVDGPTVLLCNGLGTNPYAGPRCSTPSCGVRVISWNHRGTGGSERPADPEHVGIEAFVEDAIAVMDDAGIDACVLMGWSMGVNTMFEAGRRAPRAGDRPVRRRRGPRRHLLLDGRTDAHPAAAAQADRGQHRPRCSSLPASRCTRSASACRSDRSPTRCSPTPGSCCRCPTRSSPGGRSRSS